MIREKYIRVLYLVPLILKKKSVNLRIAEDFLKKE